MQNHPLTPYKPIHSLTKPLKRKSTKQVCIGPHTIPLKQRLWTLLSIEKLILNTRRKYFMSSYEHINI